jgi:hypothetical protein
MNSGLRLRADRAALVGVGGDTPGGTLDERNGGSSAA